MASKRRSIAGVLASVMLALVLMVQSGVVCPDGTHDASRHAVHHHHGSGKAPVDAAPRVPLCCWTLANCASPAAPAIRSAADVNALCTQETPTVALMAPRVLAFAPDTPPPKI